MSIPNSVTSILGFTFYNCSSLTSVTIPETVTTIYESAFKNCSELTDVYCFATSVPSTNSNAFEGSYIDYVTLHVPQDAIEDYRNTAPWSGFGQIVALTDNDQSYKMTVTATGKGSVVYSGSTVTNGSQLFYVRAEDGAVLTLTPDAGYALEFIKVNGDDKTAEVSSGQLTIDELTADLTVSVKFRYDGETKDLTVGSAGMATFCSSDALDFSEVSGIKAYVASGFKPSNGKLLLMHVDEVPAGTGLLIKGEPGTYSIPVKSTDYYYLNLLTPVFAATTVPEQSGGYTNYVLANGPDGLLFYRSADASLAANRAYLQIPATAAGARPYVEWEMSDEQATPISTVRGEEQSSVYYNLQGQRVERPSKGIYIKNGKKVFVK